MTDYPLRQARYQYGPRKGTLGLCAHMSEGGDELVDYLANNPARGVSANFALLTTGVMWRMMPFETASGSLNPADRSTDKGYYGHSILVDVLGDHWTDPNTWCISVEIAGHAADGPNPKQIASLGVWAADMTRMFPTIRGTFGHADQTDTKACPGTTAAMKQAFAVMGGHGLWEVSMGLKLTQPTSGPVAGILTVPKGTKAIRVSDGVQTTSSTLVIRSATTAQVLGGSGGYLVNLNGDELHFVYNGNLPAGSFVPSTIPPDPQALADARAAGRESFRQDVEAIP